MENEKVINLTKQYNDLQITLDKNLGPLTEELRYFVLLEERKNEIIKEKLNSIQKKKLLFMADYLYDIKKVMEENKIISEEALLRYANILVKYNRGIGQQSDWNDTFKIYCCAIRAF